MNFGSKFKDGSLRVDIPLESLHLLFNVNYSIVSQGKSSSFSFYFPRILTDIRYCNLVNPHVHRMLRDSFALSFVWLTILFSLFLRPTRIGR